MSPQAVARIIPLPSADEDRLSCGKGRIGRVRAGRPDIRVGATTAACTPQSELTSPHASTWNGSCGRREGMTGGAPLPLAIAALAAATVVSACHDSFDVPSEPIDAPFVTVSAGILHTCGVPTVGTAYCWGWNRDGEVGDGSHTDRTFPVRVSGGLHFMGSPRPSSHTVGDSISRASWGTAGMRPSPRRSPSPADSTSAPSGPAGRSAAAW